MQINSEQNDQHLQSSGNIANALLSAVPVKKNRSCAGCYAYDDNLWKGWCSLGFDVLQIPNNEQKAYPCGKGRQYIVIKSKPAQPCTKPMTESEYVKQWRLRHST